MPNFIEKARQDAKEAFEKAHGTSQESLTRNDKIFGSEHTLLGSSNRDLILKTRGKVKVQWGNKFIDIIKNGKLNIDEIKAPVIIYDKDTDVDLSKDGFAFALDT
jgi:hypothetical protein